MKFFKKTYVFDSDWETTTSAFWAKYPNALQPHVLRVDTLDVQFDLQQKSFATLRLHSLKYSVPRWMERFFGGSSPVGFGLEESYCSLPQKILRLKSHNYTFSSFFRVDEECTYTPHPDDPSRTLYTQTATYRVFGLGAPINRALEGAAIRSAEEKSRLGVTAVESRASSLAAQGWYRRRCDSYLHSLENAANQATQHCRDFVKRKVESSFHLSAASPSSSVRVPEKNGGREFPRKEEEEEEAEAHPQAEEAHITPSRASFSSSPSSSSSCPGVHTPEQEAEKDERETTKEGRGGCERENERKPSGWGWFLRTLVGGGERDEEEKQKIEEERLYRRALEQKNRRTNEDGMLDSNLSHGDTPRDSSSSSSSPSLDRCSSTSSLLLEPSLFAACVMSTSAKSFLSSRLSPPFSLTPPSPPQAQALQAQPTAASPLHREQHPPHSLDVQTFSSSSSSPPPARPSPPTLISRFFSKFSASPSSSSSSPVQSAEDGRASPSLTPSPALSPPASRLSSCSPVEPDGQSSSSSAIGEKQVEQEDDLRRRSISRSQVPQEGAGNDVLSDLDVDCLCLQPASRGTPPMSTEAWIEREKKERRGEEEDGGGGDPEDAEVLSGLKQRQKASEQTSPSRVAAEKEGLFVIPSRVSFFKGRETPRRRAGGEEDESKDRGEEEEEGRLKMTERRNGEEEEEEEDKKRRLFYRLTWWSDSRRDRGRKREGKESSGKKEAGGSGVRTEEPPPQGVLEDTPQNYPNSSFPSSRLSSSSSSSPSLRVFLFSSLWRKDR